MEGVNTKINGGILITPDNAKIVTWFLCWKTDNRIIFPGPETNYHDNDSSQAPRPGQGDSEDLLSNMVIGDIIIIAFIIQ